MSGIELKGLQRIRFDGLLQKTEDNDLSSQHIISLPISELVPGKYQPRTEFDDETLGALAESIKSKGIIQPLVVRKNETSQYEIIAGERRWRASKIAGLAEVPVIVRDLSDETALAIGLIENIQREGLNPIDQAIALSRLVEEFSMTHQDVAKTVGFSRSSVTNLIRLLSLNDEVKDLLKQKKIEAGHAKTLFGLEDHQQLLVAHQIIEKGLSVRKTEELAKKIKRPSLKSDLNMESNNAKEWSKILTRKLSQPVNVYLSKTGKGKIEIQCNSPEELEWLVAHLKID